MRKTILLFGLLGGVLIAGKLFVSENTVKTHSRRLFDKLDASRRTQAVRRAKDAGLLA